MDKNINITINVNDGSEPKIETSGIKKQERSLPNGKETILQLPNTVTNSDNRNILELLGA